MVRVKRKRKIEGMKERDIEKDRKKEILASQKNKEYNSSIERKRYDLERK